MSIEFVLGDKVVRTDHSRYHAETLFHEDGVKVFRICKDKAIRKCSRDWAYNGTIYIGRKAWHITCTVKA